jgi:cbb3-type cytochrome oxidase subunit 3
VYQELFRGSDLLQWPIVGLLLFFLAFLGVVVYALAGIRKKRIDHVASLPLEDDDPDPAGPPAGRSMRPSRERSAGRGQ